MINYFPIKIIRKNKYYYTQGNECVTTPILGLEMRVLAPKLGRISIPTQCSM
jgi:hypothetical protein